MKIIPAVRKTADILTTIEGFCTAVLVFALVLLSLVQIIARNFLGSSINWIDPVLRHVVLWIAFVAAASATAGNRHIRIDLFPRLVSAAARRVVEPLADLVCAGICCVAGYHAWLFVADERLYGGDLVTGAPVWIFEAVMPAGFFLIALHFLLNVPLAFFGGARQDGGQPCS